MALSGKEIYRGHDEYGTVRVLDDGNKRYLSFGDTDEQSCWLKSEPLIPQHEYTRAMVMGLLFVKDPKRSLCLGLGSGTLNRCLHERFPSLKQEIVELRQEVVNVAYRYFQFPRSKRLTLTVMDAQRYLLETTIDKRVDLIISDIYTADGLDEQQLAPGFLSACADRLKPDGWLVLNCWRDHQGSDVIRALSDHFSDIKSCTTQSGNWVIYAGKRPMAGNEKTLKAQAKDLSNVLGFSLMPFVSRLIHHSGSL
jgi:spermidine synthase